MLHRSSLKTLMSRIESAVIAALPGKTISILLADDHCMVRVGLASILHSEPDLKVIAEASTAQEAVRLFRLHKPDITLLDIRMTGDGLLALRTIQTEFPTARVIMVTTHDCEEYVHAAVHTGARGYLLKSEDESSVVRAVRAVHSGETYFPRNISARLAERSQSKSLSPRESEILEFVSKGLTNKEIASVLQVSEFTVKGHLSNLLGKLGASDRTEAVSIGVQRGIISLD